ncbi:50S ribosomal protein L29 [Cesiribacter sp. SM1]|uniref:50S ribosomal protein L29 n=1 Tax=Cesiribacter sp. SM1 TaxID=2861196 RepID=UPI001CD3F638|nr:50S ribosomal protein L29 [Cesiribacter sp. SM1]
MKNEEIRSLSNEELKERIAAERESLTKLKFAHEISPIENPTKIRHSRRLIAKLETELRAKETNK